MEEINFCRTCHSSQQNSLIDIFQNNYDKLYNDLTQLPISEDDMYSKFICSTCIKELNHWEDFKKKCMKSMDEYFKDVISVNQKIEIKQELSEEPLVDSDIMLHSILEIKEEFQVPADETLYKPEKILRDDHSNKTKNFKCDRINCRYKTNCSFNLDRHLRIRHSEMKKSKCRFCPKIFIKEFRRKQHEATHIGEKKKKQKQKKVLTCDYCGYTYSEKHNLKTHMIRAHIKETIPFNCNLCPKVFKTAEYLEAHKKKVHTLAECKICNFTCSSRSELMTHQVEEHNIQPAKQIDLICDVCGKILSSPRSLRRHKETHDKEKKVKCAKCDYVTNSQLNLDNHTKRIHSTIRPYACDKCDRSYPCEYMLNHHKKTHAKERNVQCPTCEKTFKTDSALHSHKETHNNHRPYICDICNIGFKSKNALKKHSEVHEEDRETQCDLCGKTLVSKRALKRHKAVYHATG